ncbi:hypothetical protein C3K47_16360 [Solitalea longa]|uniref:Uncharacterized protein n=1 Tax=Solitalea longa TaxID=2079460 RepID=A0A2S4ZXS6_9SPHI|nr:hypothetical protein [Solitalea longa]POY35154.1 hypothetical protein C3K47_16360 [Solitalea longa]
METVKTMKTNLKLVAILSLSLAVVTLSVQGGTHKPRVTYEKSSASLSIPSDTAIVNRIEEVNLCLSTTIQKNCTTVASVYHSNTTSMFKVPENEVPAETQALNELIRFKIDAQPEVSLEEPVELTLAELVKFKVSTDKEAEIQEPENCSLSISELIKFQAPTLDDSVSQLEQIVE